MWLIDKYKQFVKNRHKKAVSSNAKTAANPKSIKDERMAAINFLCSLENADEAIPVLLPRFEFSLEHGINDTREKEAVMNGIVKFGTKAIPLLEDHLQKTNHIAWPVKIYSQIAPSEDLLSALLKCLDFSEDVAFDQNIVDKNFDILCYLREFELQDGGQSLLKFLSDHDERVRFSTAELLLEQPAAKPLKELEKFIGDTSSENIRIRQAVIKAYCERGWQVVDQSRVKPGQLIHGYFLNNKYKILAQEIDPSDE